VTVIRHAIPDTLGLLPFVKEPTVEAVAHARPEPPDQTPATADVAPEPEGGAVPAAAAFPLPPDPEMAVFFRQMREQFTRLMLEYRFGVDEMATKVSILRDEFLHLRSYNPIEHVTSRVKTPESIIAKVIRKGCPATVESIRENITDIAGLRITCSFIADTYRVLDALTGQDDVRVLATKDYIAQPKPNGYRSLHAIVQIPVFLSTGKVPVTVEVQIRTVAMDFWASLEHKIFYKYGGDVPAHLADDLAEAARTAARLDRDMEQLHAEVHGGVHPAADSALPGIDDQTLRQLWEQATGRPTVASGHTT
jgi:putative GTP pyrophosphokinase